MFYSKLSACAYRAFTTAKAVITYSLLLSAGTGGLDIASGIFTAPTGGLYRVDFKALVKLGPNQTVLTKVHRNGVNVGAMYSVRNGGSGYDIGRESVTTVSTIVVFT